VRLPTLLMFGAGYVLGTRAGRERYAQIIAAADSASKRLEAYSDRHRAEAGDGADRRARRRRAAV
jgi:hypothetical protein